MKISLLLVVATLALASAEQNKLWKMFKKMVMKTEGDKKQELQDMMQMKKTVMKTADHCFDCSRWKEASKACALDQVGGEVGKMVKDIKEQDTMGLLSKVSKFDHDVLITCTVDAMGLLEDGHLSKEGLIREAKLCVKDQKMLDETETIIEKCIEQTKSCNAMEDILQDQVMRFMQCVKPSLMQACFKNRISFLLVGDSESNIEDYLGEDI